MVQFFPFVTKMRTIFGSISFSGCSLFFVSRILPVFSGRHTGILLEQVTEVMGIIVPDFLGNLQGTHFRRFQEFLRLADPKRCQA